MTEFYIYDLETWGIDPKRDRIAQFAGVRLDPELNIKEEGLTLYCQLAPDYLPDPQSMLITGITVQTCQQKGLTEHQFCQTIHQQFSQSPVCVLGYNNIRFDDEMLRYAFYRNFIEPYGREWQHGNSRWDLLDVVRACYALRPEGIEWPTKEDGSISFRLEDLTKANQLTHAKAHDAMSDVLATAAVAKLIAQQQPRLFQYLFDHRTKQALMPMIDVAGLTPLVHVSGMFPAAQGCISWVVPLAFHPTQKNAVICFNLQQDPDLLADIDVDTLRQRLYSRTDELAADELRPALKLVHLNKCPILAPAKTLSAERAEQLGIDRGACLRHLERLKQNRDLRQRLVEIYQQAQEYPSETNPDYALYQGFISAKDQQLLQDIQQAAPEQLVGLDPLFQDDRLNSLWPRFLARNYPHLLSHQQQQQWRDYCVNKLRYGEDQPPRTIDELMLMIENIMESHGDQEKVRLLMHKLYQYVTSC